MTIFFWYHTLWHRRELEKKWSPHNRFHEGVCPYYVHYWLLPPTMAFSVAEKNGEEGSPVQEGPEEEITMEPWYQVQAFHQLSVEEEGRNLFWDISRVCTKKARESLHWSLVITYRQTCTKRPSSWVTSSATNDNTPETDNMLHGPQYPLIRPLEVPAPRFCKLFWNLNLGKAAVLGETATRIMKELADKHSPAITALINKSFCVLVCFQTLGMTHK